MPPPPPPDIRPAPAPPLRFVSCSRVLHAPPERAPGEPPRADVLELIPYRRCPVGLIAAVDCPELVAIPCLHHDPRGDRPKAVVPRAEVALLARELADDGYLTAAYRRRLTGLRVAVPPPRPLPANAASLGTTDGGRRMQAPPPRREVPNGDTVAAPVRAPVNVPSDEARRVRAARHEGGAPSRHGAGRSGP